jgi:hypothetical protein
MDVGHSLAANTVALYACKVVVIGMGGGRKIEWVRRRYGRAIGGIKGLNRKNLKKVKNSFWRIWQSQNYPALRRFLADGFRGLAAGLFLRAVGLVLAGS